MSLYNVLKLFYNRCDITFTRHVVWIAEYFVSEWVTPYSVISMTRYKLLNPFPQANPTPARPTAFLPLLIRQTPQPRTSETWRVSKRKWIPLLVIKCLICKSKNYVSHLHLPLCCTWQYLTALSYHHSVYL